jgi:hypothetical protein
VELVAVFLPEWGFDVRDDIEDFESTVNVEATVRSLERMNLEALRDCWRAWTAGSTIPTMEQHAASRQAGVEPRSPVCVSGACARRVKRRPALSPSSLMQVNARRGVGKHGFHKVRMTSTKGTLMDSVIVNVEHVQGGWSIASSLGAGPLMFLSAAKAEAQACRLAALAVRLGAGAEVWMHDRRGGLISVAIYEAVEAAVPAEAPPWRGRDRAQVSTTPPAGR